MVINSNEVLQNCKRPYENKDDLFQNQAFSNLTKMSKQLFLRLLSMRTTCVARKINFGSIKYSCRTKVLFQQHKFF